MAEFIIRVLKWLAALVVAYFVLFLVLILGFGLLVVAFQPQPEGVREDSFLVYNLDLTLTDRPREEDPVQVIQKALDGEVALSLSLREALDVLDHAATDGDIAGIVLTGNVRTGGSFAMYREIRRKLMQVGQSKPVHARLEGDGLIDLYIKSAATHVSVDPEAQADFRGLYAERIYFGKAFERFGIGVQVEAFEEYKTPAESFTRGEMSPEEEEQLSRLLDDLWSVIVEDMAESRDLDPEALDLLADERILLKPKDLLEAGLADEVMYHDQWTQHLSDIGAYDNRTDSFRQVSMASYASALGMGAGFPGADLFGSHNLIAVLYVDGAIMDGESDDDTTGAQTLIRDLREARLDASVKAIVLRINSPGGSASAAARIAREVALTNAEKPVLVSMGGMAASAGYLIAMPADLVFAEPSTITGSIGVTIMLTNIQGLSERLSLNFESVQTHQHGGMYSLARPKTEEEMRQVREQAAAFYEDFLGYVAEGREMDRDRVRELAGGRVWSGRAAKELELVDDFAGLMETIRKAGDVAGIGNDYSIMERPRRETLGEQFQHLLGATGWFSDPVGTASSGSLRALWDEMADELHQLSRLDDPHGRYAILPYVLKIR